MLLNSFRMGGRKERLLPSEKKFYYDVYPWLFLSRRGISLENSGATSLTTMEGTSGNQGQTSSPYSPFLCAILSVKIRSYVLLLSVQ
jgi:hypothetical protein